MVGQCYQSFLRSRTPQIGGTAEIGPGMRLISKALDSTVYNTLLTMACLALCMRIGDQDFTNELVRDKVKVWGEEITQLSIFAKSQPQAAASALTHGLPSKWNYFM